jgi:hypothetical protein
VLFSVRFWLSYLFWSPQMKSFEGNFRFIFIWKVEPDDIGWKNLNKNEFLNHFSIFSQRRINIYIFETTKGYEKFSKDWKRTFSYKKKKLKQNDKKLFFWKCDNNFTREASHQRLGFSFFQSWNNCRIWIGSSCG